ncbi:hypothetical protein TVAG_174620 [Trichomonas vaginalis G3]|uniref:Uncharacterized protein n=1 Tax=Trichomonas vaginalis (strain ATCC PRA-98 / G3) TaxID=412133 RepID=A2EK09_TRIV3|nr:hypothetical protein TVAGG3_0974450 [Trichomonas vaginalis G3]EAY06993.1 hypothetical protein TVAG_174620 [Trichomonas vaginalis G3]KAI5488827.1 hypothetical protein TVAGG3_0974450 [Trichomonas vaginalis G3]|eukprot:XP_001319216.1 hypothetical protein [Trichomonas vaginalis G3]
MSTVVDDIENFANTPSEKTNHKIIKQILLSLKDSNRNVVLDFRFGYNCGSIENLKLQKSIDMFKNFINQAKTVSQKIPAEQKPEKPITEKKTPQSKSKQQSSAAKPENSPAPSVKSAIPGKLNSWKKFVYRPVIENTTKEKARRETNASSASKIGKKIDRDRLIHVARKYAMDPKATREDMEGILAELDNQIEECVRYHETLQGSDKPEDQKDRNKRGLIKNLNDDVKLLREDEAKYAKSERDHRLHYLELRSFNKSDESADNNIMIGDKEDYSIALELLKEQVNDLENKLSFLRIAFPDIAKQDSLPEEEEEEEEDYDEEEQIMEQNNGEEEEEAKNKIPTENHEEDKNDPSEIKIEEEEEQQEIQPPKAEEEEDFHEEEMLNDAEEEEIVE